MELDELFLHANNNSALSNNRLTMNASKQLCCWHTTCLPML